MFKRINEWSKKPITWGGYAKLCGICWLISVLFYGGIIVYSYFDELKARVESIGKKIGIR